MGAYNRGDKVKITGINIRDEEVTWSFTFVESAVGHDLLERDGKQYRYSDRSVYRMAKNGVKMRVLYLAYPAK